jgi:glycerol uptake facilitator protein
MTGAFLGAVLAWAAYRKHYDESPEPGAALGTFATGPAIASTVDNLVTEVIGTFVLIYIILRFGDTPSEIGPLAVALLVVAIGASLGGPTGYAINPARDLGPRIAHAILPIRGKGGSNWRYAWVPVVGPLTGAVLAGGFSHISL